MADNDNEVPVTDEQKTDDDKMESTNDTLKPDTDKVEGDAEETTKDTKYESDEFETESESEVLKTDEEKFAEKGKMDSGENGDTKVKTDDEKLGNDLNGEEQQQVGEGDSSGAKEENGEVLPVNTNTEKNTEMSETGDTRRDEQAEKGDSDNEEELKTEQEQDGVTATDERNGVAETPTQEESKTEEEKEVAGQDQANEPGNEMQETAEDTKDEEKIESGTTAQDNEDRKGDLPTDAGPPIEKEDLQSKINDNEDLSLKLESALSNQEAERDAYRKLTEENGRLQKHHDDMKEKLEEMEGGHVVLVAEVETLRKVSNDQRETIMKLESEIKLLKETQGGDENVKDMQEKLIRMANEQEEKDRRVHSLEGELDATREKLKDAESRAARGGNSNAQNSKTCIIM